MTSRRDHRMHGGNRFKLGLFGLKPTLTNKKE